MKKLSIILVLALVVSTLSFPVFATSDTGTAGAEFTAGGLTIPDPGDIDPTNPGFEVFENIKSRDLDFGETELDGLAGTLALDSTVKAVENGRNNPDGKYAGFYVSDATGNHAGWQVTVKISPFTTTVDSATVPTMKGFSLKLTPAESPDGQVTNGGGVAPEPKEVTISAKLDTDGVTQITGDQALIWEAEDQEGGGLWGNNWGGLLTVSSGQVLKGESAATMTWEISATP